MLRWGGSLGFSAQCRTWASDPALEDLEIKCFHELGRSRWRFKDATIEREIWWEKAQIRSLYWLSMSILYFCCHFTAISSTYVAQLISSSWQRQNRSGGNCFPFGCRTMNYAICGRCFCQQNCTTGGSDGLSVSFFKSLLWSDAVVRLMLGGR